MTPGAPWPAGGGEADQPSQDDLTIVARSIGRTMTWRNHIDRAADVFRALRERDMTIPSGRAPESPTEFAARVQEPDA